MLHTLACESRRWGTFPRWVSRSPSSLSPPSSLSSPRHRGAWVLRALGGHDTALPCGRSRCMGGGGSSPGVLPSWIERWEARPPDHLTLNPPARPPTSQLLRPAKGGPLRTASSRQGGRPPLFLSTPLASVPSAQPRCTAPPPCLRNGARVGLAESVLFVLQPCVRRVNGHFDRECGSLGYPRNMGLANPMHARRSWCLRSAGAGRGGSRRATSPTGTPSSRSCCRCGGRWVHVGVRGGGYGCGCGCM